MCGTNENNDCIILLLCRARAHSSEDCRRSRIYNVDHGSQWSLWTEPPRFDTSDIRYNISLGLLRHRIWGRYTLLCIYVQVDKLLYLGYNSTENEILIKYRRKIGQLLLLFGGLGARGAARKKFIWPVIGLGKHYCRRKLSCGVLYNNIGILYVGQVYNGRNHIKIYKTCQAAPCELTDDKGLRYQDKNEDVKGI